MSDVKLLINDMNGTAVFKNGCAIHTMPLWVFEDMRDIIMAEVEKKVEVTHRDFDIQQELLDRYRAENAKLRWLVRMMLRVAGVAEHATDAEWQVITDHLRGLGIEGGDEG